MEFRSIADIFPDEADQRKLLDFANAALDGTLALASGESVRKALKERLLEPHRARLEAEWDLDYLSYALCYTLKLPL